MGEGTGAVDEAAEVETLGFFLPPIEKDFFFCFWLNPFPFDGFTVEGTTAGCSEAIGCSEAVGGEGAGGVVAGVA